VPELQRAAVGVGRARCGGGLYLSLAGRRPLDALADRRPASFSRTLVAPEPLASVWNTFLALGVHAALPTVSSPVQLQMLRLPAGLLWRSEENVHIRVFTPES
jgi:hypothetical protein